VEVSLILTEDGSHSLRNEKLNETYHSIHGAVQESRHVFIHHGLTHRLTNHPTSVRILEAGFGTGLNVLLTALHTSIPVYYESWELFPLPTQVVNQLNYGDQLHAAPIFQAIHQAPWNQPVTLRDNFTLHKRKADLLVQIPEGLFDIIYYDAFAPSRQPELWEFAIIQKMISALAAGGVFVTYCARGQLKRDLASLGLAVETLPGPPGKKEMVRAIR
jgi:tRNA U34 5-methylaminomethyl-2-thiouridine-forming methyltransferase MnmC